MSTTVRVGKHQLTAELICQQVSRSSLLPQLLREMIIDEVLSQWQPASPVELADGQAAIEQCYHQVSALATQRGMNHASIMQVAERTVKLQQFKQGIWGNKVGSYYLERKSQFDRVICSVMQVADGSIAQELFFRIQSGEKSFAELAVKYSQGATANDGGRIGPIAIANLHLDIARQVIQLQPGQISPLFTIGNAYVFIRLEQLIPAQYDDRLRQLLVDELFEKWLQARISTEIGLVSLASDFIPPDFMTSSQHPIAEQTPQGLKLLFPVAPNPQDPPKNLQPEQFGLERGDTGLLLSQLGAIANSPVPELADPTPKIDTNLQPEQFVLERGDTGLLLSQLGAIAHPPAPEQAVLERGDTGLLLSLLGEIANHLDVNLDAPAADLDVLDLDAPAIDSDMFDLSSPELKTTETSASRSTSGFLFNQVTTSAPITYVSNLDREFDLPRWIAILVITVTTLSLGIGAFCQLNSTGSIDTNSVKQHQSK